MNPDRRLVFWLIALLGPAMAVVISVKIASGTWERVRTNPAKRTLRVTGSATQRIVSDLIEWSGHIETSDPDRTVAYRALRTHMEAARAFLLAQGIADDEIRISSAQTHKVVKTERIKIGEEWVRRNVEGGWTTRQSISVTSKNVAIVEKASRRITDLLEKGVPISSSAPLYHYTKLSEVKVELLGVAAKNAQERANKIVRSAGGEGIGKLWNADMGVININPANSTATSWEGYNDKTAYEKDIMTIVHLTFELP